MNRWIYALPPLLFALAFLASGQLPSPVIQGHQGQPAADWQLRPLPERQPPGETLNLWQERFTPRKVNKKPADAKAGPKPPAWRFVGVVQVQGETNALILHEGQLRQLPVHAALPGGGLIKSITADAIEITEGTESRRMQLYH
jgi:hypothetical protein